MNTRRLLITGGAGFIGSALAIDLASRGYEVVALDNLSPQIHGACPEESPLVRRLAGHARLIRGDVTSADELRRALDGVETVVHLAAETGTGQSMYAVKKYADVNVGGTALLMELIANRKLPVKRVLVASSRAVYGEGKYKCPEHGVQYPSCRDSRNMARGEFEHLCPKCGSRLHVLPTDEESALRPSSVYGVTKLAQEQMVLSIGRAVGITALAFRFQNVFGPGQSLSNPYTGILSIFSTRIRLGRPVNIFEDGLETRDFVYIDDVVAALRFGIEAPDGLGDVFNIGSGVATTVLSVAKTLQAGLGKNSAITVSGQFRAGDIRHNVADITRAERSLGFTPSVTVEEGMRRFMSWVMEERIALDGYEESLSEMRERGLLK